VAYDGFSHRDDSPLSQNSPGCTEKRERLLFCPTAATLLPNSQEYAAIATRMMTGAASFSQTSPRGYAHPQHHLGTPIRALATAHPPAPVVVYDGGRRRG